MPLPGVAMTSEHAAADSSSRLALLYHSQQRYEHPSNQYDEWVYFTFFSIGPNPATL